MRNFAKIVAYFFRDFFLAILIFMKKCEISQKSLLNTKEKIRKFCKNICLIFKMMFFIEHRSLDQKKLLLDFYIFHQIYVGKFNHSPRHNFKTFKCIIRHGRYVSLFIFFRFGHSMILDNVTLRDVTFDNITQFPLHNELFNPDLYYGNNGEGVDEIIYGEK